MKVKDTKICCKCKKEKLKSDFWVMSQKKDGKDPRCKMCASDAKKRSTAKIKKENPENFKLRNKAYKKVYKLRHPERVKEQDRKHNLKYNYNMSIEDYDKLLETQNGVCAICQLPPKEKLLAVDHCHNSQIIRGLLCSSCNKAIGLFKDSPKNLRIAITYLERHLSLYSEQE